MDPSDIDLANAMRSGEGLAKLSGPVSKIGGSPVRLLLEKHKDVPFVDRIINQEKYPTRPNYDEKGRLISHSTHLLSRGGGGPNERSFVYPTLQLIDGKWVENEDPSDAIKRGNVIYFDSVDKADEFAEGSWKGIYPPKLTRGE